MPIKLQPLNRLLQSGTTIIVFVFLLSAYAHAGMILKFESNTITRSSSGGDSTSGKRNDDSSVLLEDGYFHFRGEEEEIYDFDEKNIYSVNRKKRYYSRMSLFASIGFRDYELQNRKFLSKALEHAVMEDDPLSLLFSEHELSVQDRDSKPEIIRKERDNVIVFLGSGKEMLMVGGPIIDMPEKYRKQFVRFFRHRYGGHPSIIDQITTLSGIYTDITIWQRNIDERRIHVQFNAVEETTPTDYSLEGLNILVDPNDKLFALARRTGDAPILARKKFEAEILRDAKERISNKDLIGAMLAYLEYMLVSGTHNLPWTDNERQLLLDSKDVQELLLAIQGQEAASNLIAINRIRAKQQAGSHILKVFEANIRASVNEHGIAKVLMMEALETNPYIAGAWKDLGYFFFHGYETYEAWFCWDTGRKINPTHPLFSEINNFENRLQEQHPGFF